MNETTSTALIEIAQLPEIKENLRVLRDRWEQKAAEAESLICTEESVQSLKDTRADMRKEFDEADRLRKAVKERYMAPWADVEATWRECVAEPFKRADAALKGEVGRFEDELKAKCKAEIEGYFTELCAMENVDFLSLEQAMNIGGIKINLSDAKARTPRKLQDALSGVVAKIACGMDQIAQMDERDRNEVYAEFKTCFDVGRAVAIVQGRRRAVQAEAELQAARAAERERMNQAKEKVEALAPAVASPVPQEEERYEEFSFTVFNCTRTQLIKIRDFLESEGISYE